VTSDMKAQLTSKGMSKSNMENLEKKLQNTVAILTDKRSMLSQMIMGLVEQAVARSDHECGHACGHACEGGGGIPVIILFGDEDQLPLFKVHQILLR
jgi:hypothetical protein